MNVGLSSLNDVPDEIVEIIINNVNESDLLSLRLTNRRIQEIVTPRFATSYFTHLKVFLSRHSLQMLNDICAHSVLGPQVRSINFASQRLLKAGLQSIRTGIPSTEDDDSWLSKEVVDEAMEFTLSYSLLYGEQLSMSESAEGVLLFTSALENLKQYNTPIGLGLVDNVWDYPEQGVLGSYTFGKDCFENYNHWSYWECVRSGTMRTLLTAAFRSGLPLDRLLVKFESWSLMMPSEDELTHEDANMGTIDILDGLEDYVLANVCHGLRSFELKLLNSFHDWDGATPASIASVLELATNLEVLSVDVGGASYSDFARGVTDLSHWEELETLTSAVSSQRLREIQMCNCMIPEANLTELLEKNKASFRILKISNCCIGWNGSWSGFLSSIIEKDIQLDHLILEDLYRELPGERYHPVEFIVAGLREFEGHEDITAHLSQFIAELDGSGF